jgi:hypothetical protein
MDDQREIYEYNNPDAKFSIIPNGVLILNQNNIKNEFVPYDLAVKLKNLGFGETCFAWYVSESYGLEYGKVVKSDLLKDGIVAPTFSQAFRWFRENGFLIDFSSHNKDAHDFYFKWSENKSILSDTYDTYEETELACLAKLIEIIELKSE